MFKPLIVLSILLQFVALHSSAALMKISFEGEITHVENKAAELWDPTTVVGTTIKGYMLMDTELASNGREETSYYWWDNIDSGPGALSTFLMIDGVNYSLLSENDFSDVYADYVTDEFLEYQSGIDEFGMPVADRIWLRDTERYHEKLIDGDLFYDELLSLAFLDNTNDFLTDFGPVFGKLEPQPDWLQEFVWVNDGTPNNGKIGAGSFEHYQSFTDLALNQVIRLDSTLNFNLSRVSAERVTIVAAPSALWLIVSVLVCWGFRRKMQIRS